MASAPYFAEAAPCITSIRSTLSVPNRCNSSPAPLYLSTFPKTGCPSTKSNVCRGSAPRMDNVTRPMASTVRTIPGSLKITSSTDFAALFSISRLPIIVVSNDSDRAAAVAASVFTTTSCVLPASVYAACTLLPRVSMYAVTNKDKEAYVYCFMTYLALYIENNYHL